MSKEISLESHSSPQIQALQSSSKKTLIIAVEIILGALILASAEVLAYSHGIGTIGLSTLAVGGCVGLIAIVLTTLKCLGKKSSNSSDRAIIPNIEEVQITQKKAPPQVSTTKNVSSETDLSKPVVGEIAICETLSSGAVGEDLSNLDILCPYHADIKIDGYDWKKKPNEMLIRFKVFNTTEQTEIPEKIYLPFGLFIKDDYSHWKWDGDEISFFYKNRQYRLTISQQKAEAPLNLPFHQVVEICNGCYYKLQGSILPKSMEDQVDRTTSKPFPPLRIAATDLSIIDEARHLNALDQITKNKKRFLEEFPEAKQISSLHSPVVPYHKVNIDSLICNLAGVLPEDIRFFFNETSFAIYGVKKIRNNPAQKIKIHNRIEKSIVDFPEFCPDEYLLILDYSETASREKIEEESEKGANFSGGQICFRLNSFSFST